ncbi:MAG: hypothetical protein IIA61_05895 [Candidatus Marinimicrobia bacterium]|nr:hypothetical protein [Candidatus Neomarinimicrobiota bacterium]
MNQLSLQESLFENVKPNSGRMCENNGAFELGILGFIYNAHATLTKFLEDFVVGNGFTNHLSLGTTHFPRRGSFGEKCVAPFSHIELYHTFEV